MKNNKITLLGFLFFLLSNYNSFAQDLLNQLNKEFPDEITSTIATFKTTRIGIGHSIETRKKGALEISLYNRYWNIPNFEGQRFLADVVSRRYGLTYSFTDNLSFGIGYEDHDEIADGFIKYKLLNQNKKRPVSITLLQTISHRSLENTSSNLYQPSSSENKYSFISQVLIARKFNANLSLQIAPTYVRRENNETTNDPNNQFALGFGGRHKISNHASIVSEYYLVANPLKSIDTFNAFMVGVNWELGDLLLQFQMTNARNFAEDTFITQTRNNFNAKDGNFHFGFNATFLLHTKKNKLK